MNRFVLMSCALLVVTNVVVLSGVAYNRAGEPVSSIELTERELAMPYRYVTMGEDSGTSLSLEWNVLDTDTKKPEYVYTRYVAPDWLNESKLKELGMDIEKIRHDHDKSRYEYNIYSVEAIVVFEYDGDAYAEALKLCEGKVNQLGSDLQKKNDSDVAYDLKRYEEQLAQLKISQSRLYAIDAALNVQDLLAKYGNKQKYLLLRGEVGVDWDDNTLKGYVRSIFISDIHVPLPYSKQLSVMTQGQQRFNYDREAVPPRYSVKLNVGNRFEPWLESVAMLQDGTGK